MNFPVLSLPILVLLLAPCQGLADLEDLFEDFYAVANLGEVVDLLRDKLEAEDADVMRVVGYMNSSDFRAINDFMWDYRGSLDLYRWCLRRNLPVDDFFEWLYDFLAWGDFRARLPLLSGHGDGRSKRSLTSLVDEVRALIPFEKVLAWVYEQLVTNDDMLVLMRKLHDESVHAVWVHLYKSPEFLELRCDLITEEGFELRGRERMLCDFLGWDDDGCPSPPCPEAPDGVAPSPKTANKTKVKPKRGS